MGTPAEFRENARRCVEFATTAMSDSDQDLLLDLAVKWLRLAGANQHEMDLIAGLKSVKPVPSGKHDAKFV